MSPGVEQTHRFATTRWSVVLAAGAGTHDATSREALAALAGTYWLPLYSFVRRQGSSPHDAEDLTQAFIARLIEKDYLAQVDPAKGRFRTYLLACLRHFLSNQRDHERAAKRGGGQKVIAIDGLSAEARYQLEPATDLTPDRLFERQWALALLDRVLARLGVDYANAGKRDLFDALKPALLGDSQAATYAQIGRQLRMNETAVKVAVHRLRARYRQLLREEVAQTVSSDQELDAELSDLLNCL